MTLKSKRACSCVIHGTSIVAASVGGGLAQLPMSDSAALLPLQISMILALGRVFGVEVTEAAAKGVVMGAVAGAVGRASSQVAVGWIPVAGNVINAGTAAALTEAIGWATVRRFQLEACTTTRDQS